MANPDSSFAYIKPLQELRRRTKGFPGLVCCEVRHIVAVERADELGLSPVVPALLVLCEDPGQMEEEVIPPEMPSGIILRYAKPQGYVQDSLISLVSYVNRLPGIYVDQAADWLAYDGTFALFINVVDVRSRGLETLGRCVDPRYGGSNNWTIIYAPSDDALNAFVLRWSTLNRHHDNPIRDILKLQGNIHSHLTGGASSPLTHVYSPLDVGMVPLECYPFPMQSFYYADKKVKQLVTSPADYEGLVQAVQIAHNKPTREAAADHIRAARHAPAQALLRLEPGSDVPADVKAGKVPSFGYCAEHQGSFALLGWGRSNGWNLW